MSVEASIRLAGGNRLIKVEDASVKENFENMAMAYEAGHDRKVESGE